MTEIQYRDAIEYCESCQHYRDDYGVHHVRQIFHRCALYGDTCDELNKGEYCTDYQMETALMGWYKVVRTLYLLGTTPSFG